VSAIDVTVSVTIGVPRAEVATYVIDHRHDPVWIGGITGSGLLDDRRSRSGPRCGGWRRT
jgi:hypothetical protein